jgi:ketosteroid isomerase-like protein
MRLPFVLCFMFAMICTPVLAADDQSSKQEVDKIAAAFKDSFDKQNSVEISALFTKDGVLVNPTGPHTDIAKFYDGAFKAGLNQIQIMVNEVTPVDPDKDTMIGIGEYQIAGKSASGTAIQENGNWTATYVREGGAWKIRMLTGFPKAPPPK